jgi:hypothetical protein
MDTTAFASAGSQRWLQIAVARAPELLDAALRRAAAIGASETVFWGTPLAADKFREYRDGAALRCLGIQALSNRRLEDFWPRGGPVWDALGVASGGAKILVEAKAHIAEVASRGSKASTRSLDRIRRSLHEARAYYAPRAKVEWTGSLYQYANRLAFHFLLSKLNGIPSRLVFLDFLNAADVSGPESEAAWMGATELTHALLGLPPDLRKFGVFHSYVDVRELQRLGKRSVKGALQVTLDLRADTSFSEWMRFSEIPDDLRGRPGIYEIRSDLTLLKVGMSVDLYRRLRDHARSPQRGLKGSAEPWENPSQVASKRSILAKHLYFDRSIAPEFDLRTEDGRRSFLETRCMVRYQVLPTEEAALAREQEMEERGGYRYLGDVLIR